MSGWPKGQQTYCAAPSDRKDDHPDFGPRLCGAVAVGPDPDPEVSYRRPLCRLHLDAAAGDGEQR